MILGKDSRRDCRMSEKTTLDELVELLVQRKQLQKADAEAFVRTFLSLLESALIADRYVKIKGLGTLKLIDSEIGKELISFVPDTSLSEAINKPFSQFETVLLKENVHFDDISEPLASDDKIVSGVSAGCETKCERQAEAMSASEKDDGMSGIKFQVRNMPWCVIATILLVGVIIGGAVVWTMVSGRRYIPESVIQYVEKQLLKNNNENAQRDAVFQRVETDTVKCSDKEMNVNVSETKPKVEEKHFGLGINDAKVEQTGPLSDTVKYITEEPIVPHVLRRGESLAKLAQKYYGNKNLWPYLAKYNHKCIPDADNLPVGTTVLIPRLVPKK